MSDILLLGQFSDKHCHVFCPVTAYCVKCGQSPEDITRYYDGTCRGEGTNLVGISHIVVNPYLDGAPAWMRMAAYCLGREERSSIASGLGEDEGAFYREENVS